MMTKEQIDQGLKDLDKLVKDFIIPGIDNDETCQWIENRTPKEVLEAWRERYASTK
jgi:hypothetical protein